jgi:N-acetylglucosamine-6-sulfatase
VNGARVPQRGCITDELTDYALDWLRAVPTNQPFFLHLSHKAVHHEFIPAERHRGRHRDRPVPEPASQADTEANYRDKPRWVRDQRNSWHGVDFGYHARFDMAAYHRRYMETLLAVDENVGRVLDALAARGQLAGTLVVYPGDNGFLLGEHGLIDKRRACEESMRVPLLAHCPELFRAGTVVTQLVAILDLMPDRGGTQNLRSREGSPASAFPARLVVEPRDPAGP